MQSSTVPANTDSPTAAEHDVAPNNAQSGPGPADAGAEQAPVLSVMDAQPTSIPAQPAPVTMDNELAPVELQPGSALAAIQPGAHRGEEPTSIVNAAAQAIQALTAVAEAAAHALLNVANQAPPPSAYFGYPTLDDRGLSITSLPDRMRERTVSRFSRCPQPGGHRNIAVHSTLRRIRNRDDVHETGPERYLHFTSTNVNTTTAREIGRQPTSDDSSSSDIPPSDGTSLSGGDSDGGTSSGGGVDHGASSGGDDREASQTLSDLCLSSSDTNSGVDSSTDGSSTLGSDDEPSSSGNSSPCVGYYADLNFLNGEPLLPAEDLSSPGPAVQPSPLPVPAPRVYPRLPDAPLSNFLAGRDDPARPGNVALHSFFAERQARRASQRAVQNAYNRLHPIHVTSDAGSPSRSGAVRAARQSTAGPSKKRGRGRETSPEAPAKRMRRDEDGHAN